MDPYHESRGTVYSIYRRLKDKVDTSQLPDVLNTEVEFVKQIKLRQLREIEVKSSVQM